MSSIAQQIKNVLNQIQEYETCYHRHPGSVQLLLASKSQPITKIQAAYDVGQTRFGENYVQEALLKIEALQHLPIEWHFIGAIQSNKTRLLAEHFSWVQTVANSKMAKRLNDQRPQHLPPLNICLQVNISHEPTKSGATAEGVIDLINFCSSLQRLRVRGIMVIPAPKNSFAEQRAECQKSRILFENLREIFPSLTTLSMGMSDDLEAAIAEGSTMVRIGTKIFGHR